MKNYAEEAQRYFDALKRITSYLPPERLRRIAEKQYGVSEDEAIEMAYDNVLGEAADAVRGKRRPVVAMKQSATHQTPAPETR